MLSRIVPLILALTLSTATLFPLTIHETVEAKPADSVTPFGECTYYYFAQWTTGNIPPEDLQYGAGWWLITKIITNCDVDGGWR